LCIIINKLFYKRVILSIFTSFAKNYHVVIIASLLLSINACGYRGSPYYVDEVPASDKNIDFKLKKKSFDNNESCKTK